MKNYWIYLNKNERNGIFLLLIVLIIVSILKLVQINKPSISHVYPFGEIHWDTIFIEKDTIRPEPKRKKKSINTPRTYTARYKKQLFPFDPNTLSEDSLKLLDLGEFVALNIIKYRSRGGRFLSKSSVKKIYGMTEERFLKIEPYLQLPGSQSASVININRATKEELKSLTGIGEILSNRIVKYREKLGGFYHNYQLKEVYGLSDSTLQYIQAKIKCLGSLDSVNINSIDYQKLSKHPYISWKQASVIINYRTQHGPFKGPVDLEKIRILNDTTVKKILPYLSFNINP